MKRFVGYTTLIFIALYGFLFWHFPETRVLIITKTTSDKLTKMLSGDWNARSVNVLKPKLNTKQTSDKWIIVATSAPLSEDIKYLARLPGWRVLIVGDKNTTNDWTFQNCDFLSTEKQEKLGFQITHFSPEESLSRKNVGYLYAIANGAKLIYDTVIGNRPLDKLKGYTYSEEFTGLLYTGQNKTFNSYRHFGLSNLWPRGYPLNEIGKNISHDYVLGTWSAPLIQQGLVNGDLGEEAILGPMQKIKAVPSNVNFSINSPPVMVRSNAYSPFNSQNTLYRYDAFWGLFLPTTISVHVRDIWRSYWSQRLLWEVGGNIAFYPPNTISKRNHHSHIYDNFEDAGLYFKTENLLKFLSDWTCKQKYSFFDCVLDLTYKMIEKKYLNTNDKKLISSWIDDLKSVNYTEPKRIHVNNTVLGTRKIRGQTADKSNTSIIFIPQNETASYNYTNYTPEKYINRILHLCPHFAISKDNISYISNVKRNDNILLIVEFNKNFYGNIRFLDILYRIYFPNIVYCGENSVLFEKLTRNLQEQVSFIEINVHLGFLAQRCMLQAMQMNYGVDGYLYISDDVFLYSKQLSRYTLDKILISHVRLLMEDKEPSPYWYWFKTPYGVRAYQNGLNYLYNTSIKAYNNFRRNLRENTGFNKGFFEGTSDIVYLPAKYSKDFLFYMDIFTRQNVFLEIAFPTVIAGITKMENIHFLNGTYLWDKARRNALARIEEKKDFVHPVKLSGMNRKDICEKVIKPNIFN